MQRLAAVGVIVLLCHDCASALTVMPRRQALVRLGAATLAAPLVPAQAKSKKSLNPNKPYGNEGFGLDPAARQQQFEKEKASMAGDKGSRGTEFDKDFDKLEKSRVPRANSNVANRNRDPAELGLKQWGG